MNAKNLKTGHRIEIEFSGKNWFSDSSVDGKCFDKEGNLLYKISGSWKNELKMTKVKQTGAPPKQKAPPKVK